MKTIVLFLLAILPVSLSAQDLVPVKRLRPSFYNESGTQVYRIGSLDTLTTQAFNLAEYDEIAFSLATEGASDSAHVQLMVMYGDGTGSGNGFYATGYETMSAKVDSISSNGSRNGPKTGMGYTVKKDRLTGATVLNYMETNGATGVASSDSVVTYNYFTTGQFMWVKFVLVGEINDNQEVSNSDWLNNSLVVLRRFD